MQWMALMAPAAFPQGFDYGAYGRNVKIEWPATQGQKRTISMAEVKILGDEINPNWLNNNAYLSGGEVRAFGECMC